MLAASVIRILNDLEKAEVRYLVVGGQADIEKLDLLTRELEIEERLAEEEE